MRVAILNCGAGFQIEAIEGPRYAKYFTTVLRPEDTTLEALLAQDVFILPCHTPLHRILPHRETLLAFLDAGKTLVSTGRSKQAEFLPNIRFEPCPTNFWWWTIPGEILGTQIAKPAHSLFHFIDLKALTWHLHGFYEVPEGAEVLAVGPTGKAFFYIDDVTTRGRMIVTSLDPFSHHGRHFMPSATRFLDGLLPWLHTPDALRLGVQSRHLVDRI